MKIIETKWNNFNGRLNLNNQMHLQYSHEFEKLDGYVLAHKSNTQYEITVRTYILFLSFYFLFCVFQVNAYFHFPAFIVAVKQK